MKKKIKKLKPIGGLRLLPKDDRDFQLGNITKLPKLEDLPATFVIETLNIKHQGQTDYCTAYATCTTSEVQEKVKLNPDWTFAATKLLAGDPDSWGADLRTACKSHVKLGALEEQSIEIKGDKRRFESWPIDLSRQALIHRKKSYFKITGPYDAFDNIRASLFYYKTPIVLGTIWGWPLSDIFMEEPSLNGFGHAITATGWNIDPETKETFLIIQNSYGEEAGARGRHYFSKKVINETVDRFGAFTFIDLDKDSALLLNKWQKTLSWRWLAKVISFIKKIWQNLQE